MMNLNISILKCLIFVLFMFLSIFRDSPVFAIKIGLLDNVHSTNIASSRPGNIIDGNTGKVLFKLEPMQIYTIVKNKRGMNILAKDKYYPLYSNYLIASTLSNAFLFAKKGWYRGRFIVLNMNKGFSLINELDLESYIMGVVPAEMPSKWNLEALKAQAIAARSYAIANRGKRSKRGYDLKDTPHDQAYGGASAEKRKTNLAVLQTKGEVLVHQNKVIPAYYHSSSGGHTLSPKYVWSKDLPFIKQVQAFDDQIPKNGHGVGMSQHGANVLANHGYSAYQILAHFYKNIRLYRYE